MSMAMYMGNTNRLHSHLHHHQELSWIRLAKLASQISHSRHLVASQGVDKHPVNVGLICHTAHIHSLPPFYTVLCSTSSFTSRCMQIHLSLFSIQPVTENLMDLSTYSYRSLASTPSPNVNQRARAYSSHHPSHSLLYIEFLLHYGRRRTHQPSECLKCRWRSSKCDAVVKAGQKIKSLPGMSAM